MSNIKRKKTGKLKNKKGVKRKSQFGSYSKESLRQALDAVIKGASLRSSSEKFKVPFSTLRDKYKGKSEIGKKSGPPTILTNSEESYLVNWISSLCKRGVPVTKNMILDSVQLFLKNDNRKHCFTNGRPGRHWFESFQKRHPELSLEKSQNLDQKHTSLTQNKLFKWFKDTEDYLREKDLLNIDPSRVFNYDEVAFMLNPVKNSGIVPNNSKNFYNIVKSNDKKCLITLFAGNAAGQMVPPLLMYSYKRLFPPNIYKNVPREWGIGRSDSGWITKECFCEYVGNIFHPWCVKNSIQFPVIMYFDAHSSHITLPLSEFCMKNKIELILLYPKSTHISQPIDIAIFQPLEDAWKTSVTNWRMENEGALLKKWHFAGVLKNALESIDIKNKLINGFATSGLSPFNTDAVNYELLFEGDSQSEEMTNQSLSEEKNYEITCKRTITFIENVLNETIVQLFKSTENKNDDWEGDEKYKYFFDLWQYCYRWLKTNSNNSDKGSREMVVDVN